MAGYIINLDSDSSLSMYIENGVYATKLSTPDGRWRTHHEGTFADYATMKPNDNIYFFIRRKIYGIGRLVEIEGDCKFLNYPDANKPLPFNYDTVRSQLLWDEGPESINQRWICVFEPNPWFFACGIDMDDVLSSNPQHFKMLRAFWKVSFIKIDDDENQALMDVILRANQDILLKPAGQVFPSSYRSYHNILASKINSEYCLAAGDILSSCADGSYIRHEMAIEAGLLYQLSIREPGTIAVLGEWDYLSHQVVASPFKPVDYMDKMDVFGYSYIPGFDRTKSKFMVAELKKDGATSDDVDQVMKYVDWVKDEYCFGDYSMIQAFLIAYDFSSDVITHAKQVGERKYIIGRRPARSGVWSSLKLVKYRFNPTTNLLELLDVPV